MPNPFDDLFAPGMVPSNPAIGADLARRSAPFMNPPASSPFDDLFDPGAVRPTPATVAPVAAAAAPRPPIPMPPQVGFNLNSPAPPRSPNFVTMALPMIASALIGGKDPRAMAEGLAAFMQGRELRRAERESLEDRTRRRQQEQAEFYSRAIAAAQAFDDPIAFEQWKDAIAPVAQVHGIDPAVFTFTDKKLADRTKKEAGDLLATLDRQHPDGNYTLDWKDPKTATVRRITRAELARLAAAATFDAQGQPLAPAFRATTPDEMKIAAYARIHGKRVEDLTPAEIAEATGIGKTPAGAPNSPMEAEIADALEAEKARLGRPLTPQERSRVRTAAAAAFQKAVGTADDRPRPLGPSDYQQFGMGERLATAWTKANASVKEMDRQLRIMQTGLQRFRRGDKNGGSQAVLVTFQKILDPTSVVRESEYARTTDGQALLDRIEGYMTRLAQGGANLTDREMAAMVATAAQMFEGMRAWNAGTRARIERVAKQNGIPLENVFDDLLTGDTGPPPRPAAGAPDAPGDASSALAELERRRRARQGAQ